MHWNHRVIRREVAPGLFHLFMVEVYYDDDDHSILGWTEKEEVWGDEEHDGIEGVRQTLRWMLEATEKPVLDEATLLREAEERGPIDYGPFETFDSLDDLLAELEEDDPGITERVRERSKELEEQSKKGDR